MWIYQARTQLINNDEIMSKNTKASVAHILVSLPPMHYAVDSTNN